jgi:hypothetical protein
MLRGQLFPVLRAFSSSLTFFFPWMISGSGICFLGWVLWIVYGLVVWDLFRFLFFSPYLFFVCFCFYYLLRMLLSLRILLGKFSFPRCASSRLAVQPSLLHRGEGLRGLGAQNKTKNKRERGCQSARIELHVFVNRVGVLCGRQRGRIGESTRIGLCRGGQENDLVCISKSRLARVHF